jgi:hypothetical protein
MKAPLNPTNPTSGDAIDLTGSQQNTTGSRIKIELQPPRKKLYQVLNAVSFLLCVAFNGASASGALTGTRVGAVSDENPTLITPASYAFSIWSIIYTLVGAFAVYQALPPSWCRHDDALIFESIGPWFIAVNITNALWLITFTINTEAALWLSTILIFMLLGSIITLYQRSKLWQRVEVHSSTSRRWLDFILIDLAFSLYGGWVTVASIVNVSAALYKSGWDGGAISPEVWSPLMLFIALIVNSLMVYNKQDAAWPAVLVWAAVAISKNENVKAFPSVEKSALAVAVLAGMLSAGTAAWRVFRSVQSLRN